METIQKKIVQIAQLGKQCKLMMTKRSSDMCFYLPCLNSVLLQLGQWVRYGNALMANLCSVHCNALNYSALNIAWKGLRIDHFDC